jgi:hypothetical protein
MTLIKNATNVRCQEEALSLRHGRRLVRMLGRTTRYGTANVFNEQSRIVDKEATIPFVSWTNNSHHEMMAQYKCDNGSLAPAKKEMNLRIPHKQDR